MAAAACGVGWCPEDDAWKEEDAGQGSFGPAHNL